MALRTVLFDCDGTLVDSQHMIVATMTGAFARMGLPEPAREAVLGIIGLSLPEAVAKLVPGLDAATVDKTADTYRTIYTEQQFRLSETAPLYPGALEALSVLTAQPDMLIGIVTGKSRRGLDAILATHGLSQTFAVLRTADDGPSKPHPFMVTDAVAELGADVARTVVVGDTGFDMAMARAAGAHAIGVTWGYHGRDELNAAGAEVIIDSFDELEAAVAGLLAVEG